MVERASAFAGKNVVITAGPTREYLDDIRFLSNASTGRMGYELARAAARQDADVTLIGWGSTRGPTQEAVDRARAAGESISAITLRHLMPVCRARLNSQW